VIDTSGWTESTTTHREPCGHKNGWYHTINGFFVDKKFFVCIDCHRILDRKIKENTEVMGEQRCSFILFGALIKAIGFALIVLGAGSLLIACLI